MEPQAITRHDSEKTDDEKGAVGQYDRGLEDAGEIANLPPDPDAHMSPEERARVVRILLAQPRLQLTIAGTQVTLEARPDPDSMGERQPRDLTSPPS
jgi:hypothetical protein